MTKLKTKGVWTCIKYKDEVVDETLSETDPRKRRPTIYLWVRDTDLKRHRVSLKGFRPYFYTIPAIKSDANYIFEMPEIEKSELVEFGKRKLYRIFTYIPGFVTKVKKVIQTRFAQAAVREGDVLFELRYLIDQGLRGEIDWYDISNPVAITEDLNIPLRRVYLDTEIWAIRAVKEGHMWTKEYIKCLSAYDNYEKLYYTWYFNDYNLDIKGDSSWKIIWCRTIDEMMTKFLEYVRDRDPDVITGYNIDFDLLNIRQEALRRGLSTEFNYLSALSDLGYGIKGPVTKKHRIRGVDWSRRGLLLDGREVIDILDSIRMISRSQLRSYTLDYVAKKFIDKDEGKLRYKDQAIAPNLTWIWEEAPEEVLKYNKHDVELVVRLDEKNDLIDFLDMLRKTVGVRLEDAFSNQRMIDSEALRRRKFPLPSKFTNKKDEKETYKGALVVTPVLGLHKWVLCLDYKSLYPTIIRTYNIDTDSYVLDLRFLPKGREVYKFSNLDSTKTWMFVKNPRGLFPQMLDDFTLLRDSLRGKMEKETDPNKKKLLDIKQEVIKVLSNAVYGAFGYRSRKHNLEVAEAIAAFGQKMIRLAADIAVEMGFKVIYGDSVLPDTPVIIQRNGRIQILPIVESKIGDMVYSEKGFTKILKVIHKPLRKKIWKIQTRKGLVYVTEDHSLLNELGNKRPPKDFKLGDGLLQTSLPLIKRGRGLLTKEKAWLYGLFTAEGSAHYYPNLSKATLKIDMNTPEILKRARKVLGLEGIRSSIYDIPSSGKGMKRLQINAPYGQIKEISNEWHKMFYDSNGKKKIPEIVLNSRKEIMLEFLRGYDLGNGSRDKAYRYEFQDFQTDSKTLAQGLCFLLENLGRDYCIQTREDKPSIIRIRINTPGLKKGGYKRRGKANVLKIRNPIAVFAKEVIDLETQSGHFNAGVGEIVVHNTDSIFVMPGTNSYGETYNEGIRLQDEIMRRIPKFTYQFGVDEKNLFVINLEKVYDRFFMAMGKSGKAAKKRYCGRIIQKDGKTRLDVKGLDTKRSDTSEFAGILQQHLLSILLEGRLKSELASYIANELNSIDKLPLEKIGVPSAISKPLKKGYKKNPIQKKAAVNSNTYLGTQFEYGSKPLRIYIKIPDREKIFPRSGKKTEEEKKEQERQLKALNVIAFDNTTKFPDWVEIDYPKMLKNTVKPKIDKFLESLDIAWDEIETLLRPEFQKKKKKGKEVPKVTLDNFMMGGDKNA